MGDIKDLLGRTGRPPAAPPAEAVEADLRRGRSALGRQRRRRALAFSVAGTFAAGVLAGTSLLVGGGADNSRQLAGPESSSAIGSQETAQQVGSGVRLVSYTGEQLDGFVVDQVPEGWFLQGSNTIDLTIAPDGDKSHPDDFRGKLVVMLLSSSAPQELPEGKRVEVGGNDGVISSGAEADTLTYEDGNGHFVQVQAWRSPLNWSTEELIRFAEGVTVTSDAEAGVG